MAKIITFFNQKGGCGKTTIAMNVAAVLATDYKAKVMVVDGDSQGSASRWIALADEDKPFPASIVGMAHIKTKAHQEIKKFKDDYDYIIVDCPPTLESVFSESALVVSDVGVLPVIPSPNDFFSVAGAEFMIERISEINDALNARVVFNSYQPNLTMTHEIEDSLSKSSKLGLFNARIGQRTAYRQAVVKGGSVLDMKDIKAKLEMRELVREILLLL